MSLRIKLYLSGLTTALLVAAIGFAMVVQAAPHKGNPDDRPLIPLIGPGEQTNAIGLAGTIDAPPPDRAPTISTPSNGQGFRNDPVITIGGFCVDDLLVKVFNNDILAGATICNNGSYSLRATLFTGENELYAVMIDNLDQSSPRSNIVKVSYANAQFEAFGTLVTLTSSYARRGADPGKTLSWPLVISGGSGPYALTIDWGDGQGSELVSQPLAGSFNIEHIYSKSGVYQIVIKAVDRNQVPAFLQLVGVSNGQLSQGLGTDKIAAAKTDIVVRLVWWPAVVLFVLSVVAFWLGRRYEMLALRKRIEREAREFAAEDAAADQNQEY